MERETTGWWVTNEQQARGGEETHVRVKDPAHRVIPVEAAAKWARGGWGKALRSSHQRRRAGTHLASGNRGVGGSNFVIIAAPHHSTGVRKVGRRREGEGNKNA
jgi:hypothetical protein